MGCTVGDKHFRANRRARSLKSALEHGNNNGDKSSVPSPAACLESGHGSPHNTNFSSNPNSDETGCGFCTEEQLEEILLKNLEFLYNEAVSKLVALGYDEEFSLNTILKSGHSYGQSDVLTNIMHNSLSYLNDTSVSDDNTPCFSDLKQLVEYSLAALICFLQRIKPHWSKGDAMWCLLMSDLHLTRASTFEFPVTPSSNNAASMGSSNNPTGINPASCKFHGGWGFGNGGTSEFPSNESFSYASETTLQREIECPKKYNLTPSMKSLLKKNVALFAAGFRANSRQLQIQSQVPPTSVTGLDRISEISNEHKNSKEFQVSRSHEVVANAVLSKFREMNLDEGTECVTDDQKDEVILNLIRQITDLEKQVKERKEWAHQKAIQAARKLSTDLTELKMLRTEKEETQRSKKGKQTLEDSTMKRLSDMENSLRKASGQVDRANAGVRRLEVENAEIRAEMEAAKLSASESINACLEVAKREKKCLKKLLVWEKQKTKLQDEISAENLKLSELQKELVQTEAAQKKAEEKWKQEQKGREVAEAEVEKERHLKEETESNNKRKLEALRLKIEIDFQLHKDDIQRLEQELSRLQVTAAAATTKSDSHNHNHQPKNSLTTDPPKSGQETRIAKLLNKLDASLEKNGGGPCNTERKCLICKKEEVSVVFLPCTHQVLCSSCNDIHGKKGKTTCPSCRLPIEQRIRVFGAAS
ncbi:MND1-interacting protein 1-like [Impatiens glandulifera]|uniref:MND1-interacting protein 1-like n=1 Tax=Impatiens glandulifera TaxID=253017 RepID=UPI001FB08F26|nr:MND1-interacting protein 1-like [Impatiens glandulifera]